MPIAMKSAPAKKSFGLRVDRIKSPSWAEPPGGPRRPARSIASAMVAAEKRAGPRACPSLPCQNAASGSDAVLRAEILEVLVEPLGLQPLRELRLHFLEARHLRVADVVDLDHVPAELR